MTEPMQMESQPAPSDTSEATAATSEAAEPEPERVLGIGGEGDINNSAEVPAKSEEKTP